jgi:anti-sigma-K factor RskA
MNNETTFDLLPAYALGTLSEEERVQVESLLATSEEARIQLRQFESMLAGMATLVPPRKAPAGLNDAFRQRLAAEVATEPESKVVTFPPRVGWIRRPRLLLSLAAVFAVVVGLLAIYGLATRKSDSQIIQDILNDPAATRIAMNAEPGANGNVTFVIAPDNSKAVLVAELPELPDDKQYQFWFIQNDNTPPTSGLVFSADKPEQQILISMQDPSRKFDQLGVTVEPLGGSPAPTTNPIFLGKRPA